jgi:hypothetical protein
MDAHLNVLLKLRRVWILSLFVAGLLFAGCASEPLTIDGRSPLGEPPPPPAPGPRGGWAW